MIKTKSVYSKELAHFYTLLGWEVVSEDDAAILETTYHLQVNIKDEHKEAFEANEHKAENLLRYMNALNRPFGAYWFNNIILSILSFVTFMLVANKHQFFDAGSFTWPFIGELIGWVALVYFGLHAIFLLFKTLYKKAQTRNIVELGKINKTYLEN